MPYRIGVDIGGTFTDFALLDDVNGKLAIHKQLTTPHDPSLSVIEGCSILLEQNGVSMSDVESIVHGTTLVTNALIERKGAVTGMLVTKGFSDVLDIALERRYDLFDLGLRFPAPLVPRYLRCEVEERMNFDGSIDTPLDLTGVREKVQKLIDEHEVKSIAICLLHSYLNPQHEMQLKDFVRKEFPDLYVSVSSEIFPYIREYERWTTTTINAYAQPLVERYIARLEDGLRQIEFAGRLYIMASNGGTITPETASLFPVRMLESGPAAGALMSAIHGRRLNQPDILSFDMGGTTAKGCIIQRGEPLKNYSLEVARIHEFKAGSGLPVRIPVIDMIEIGSGGGSIAEVDARNMIRVGPRSTGADPGPACYGRGGTQPSLTDADLLLGYLDPNFFLGGKFKLDVAKSEDVIGRRVGEGLSVDATRAAWGIHEIANEDVARAFRVHASERGIDYRNCAMVAFGGAGPLRAMRIARKLKIPRVIFPVGAGVMSALGLLASPLSFETVKSNIVSLSKLNPSEFAARFGPLVNQTSDLLRQSGVEDEQITSILRLDMRYEGQGYEVEVTLPEGKLEDIFEQLKAKFEAAYEAVFSMSFLNAPIEIVNWKVETRGPSPVLADRYQLTGPGSASIPKKGERRAYFPETGYRECPVYDRYSMVPGQIIAGPALIEENESTCVIGIGDSVTVDVNFNLIGEISEAGVAA